MSLIPTQDIRITDHLEKSLTPFLKTFQYDKLFVLVDTNTHKHCFPLLPPFLQSEAEVIEIPAGEESKNIHSVMKVWESLSEKGATRSSILINLGGGMVTDLGGFAASSFKRGIRFINLPTTILGAVDASLGGKTGIDFNGLKNEVGFFRLADAVVVYHPFFRTLDKKNQLSGFAEMLKHALLSSKEVLAKHFDYSFSQEEETQLMLLVTLSIEKKNSIIEEDFEETGLRKALNFGHTVGHAIESRLLERNTPVLHGYAVAWGIVSELYLSHILKGFPSTLLSQIAQYVRNLWGDCPILCKEYEELFSTMLHDKKNRKKEEINFTLLSNVGEIQLNQTATKEQIFESLDFLIR